MRDKKKTKKKKERKKDIKIISVNHICKKSLMTFSRYDFDAKFGKSLRESISASMKLEISLRYLSNLSFVSSQYLKEYQVRSKLKIPIVNRSKENKHARGSFFSTFLF